VPTSDSCGRSTRGNFGGGGGAGGVGGAAITTAGGRRDGEKIGRIDDVINVAGHRLGTKEIESASLLVDQIAEAAVIPARDEIKGKVPDLYVSLKPGYKPSEEIRKHVEDAVIREIGPIARPRRIMIVPDMPKTRSGKIMRRVLAAISNNEDAGDISTLANPEIVEEIRQMKS